VKDYIVLAALLLSFATLVTVHVYLAFRLVARTRPRWRGAVALVVPPLAPIWAFREGWRRSGTLWIAALLAYVVARIAAT
jgi:hypothetical protein